MLTRAAAGRDRESSRRSREEEEGEEGAWYRYKTSAPRSVAPTSALGSVAPTYLPRQRHLDAPLFPARHLGAKTYCAETCYLGAVGHGADP